jgi:cell division protein FtsZ
MAKIAYVPSGAQIKVIGLGGAGCNAITRMVREQIRGVEFIAMNTDAQALAITEAPIRLQIGEKITRGLGAGGDDNVGRLAAEESINEISQAVSGADMVFIAAGMGGGTGTGSAPVVAELTKKSGALTIAVVTKPFSFEGVQRTKVADAGIAELMSRVDTLIIIPNDRLFQLANQKTGIDSAFKMADEVLYHGVQAIAEVVTVPGVVNLDFADVRAIMNEAGPAWMSIGYGSGPNGTIDAAKAALASPLLDVSIEGARGVLFNITGGKDLSLLEVSQAAEVIKKAVDPEANVIFGVATDQSLDSKVRLTLIATGFATKDYLLRNQHEAEIMHLLKGTGDDELEIPTFLRHHHTIRTYRKEK